MPEKNFLYHIRYYAIYQLIFVAFTVILSSAGAFFHFLLEHEISIVEAWLHNNHWEILLISKIGSLFLINRWFQIRLYQVKSIKELVMKLLSWPDTEAPVISIFMLVSYIALAKVSFVGQNMGYWYYHLVGFVGIFLFFGLEFVVIAQLDDVLGAVKDELNGWKSLCYLVIFAVAYRMSVPDYYELLPYMLFCFSTLLYLSGKSLKNWSNVVCFLLLFVAPMGAIFGLDPAWGNDFSPLKIDRKVSMSLLAAIWLVSFCYYKYRNQFFHSVRKLLR
jgi:hypothetical protein